MMGDRVIDACWVVSSLVLRLEGKIVKGAMMPKTVSQNIDSVTTFACFIEEIDARRFEAELRKVGWTTTVTVRCPIIPTTSAKFILPNQLPPDN
jgi:hypothetical protein